MKSKIHFEPYKTFVFRTPLLPYTFLKKISEDPEQNLEKVFNDKVFQEALFISSENLFIKLKKYLASEKNTSKEKEKLTYSLLKYLHRMCTRCTPFGYFASVNAGKIETCEKNNIFLKNNSEIVINSEADSYFLYKLMQKLLKNQNILEKLSFYVNTSLYKVGDFYRYIEVDENNEDKFRMVSVEKDVVLENIIKKAEKGITYNSLQVYIKDLLAKVYPKENFDNNEINDYVFSLVQSQILITNLQPKVTNYDFYEQLLTFVQHNSMQFSSTFVQKIEEINANILAINKGKIGNVLQHYSKIKKITKSFEFNIDSLLVNLELKKKISQAEISHKTVNYLTKALKAFFTLAEKKHCERLVDFKNKFIEQYEEQEIQLVNALDPEFGLLYAQVISDDENDIFIKDLDLPKTENNTIKINKEQKFIIDKITKANISKFKTIYINDTDLANLNYDESKLPQNFTCLAKLLSASPESEDLLSLVGVYSGTASKPIARFANNNKNIEQLIDNITKDEICFNKDAVFAEIAFLPVDKTANIVNRPAFYDYEITYMARSGKKKLDKQIPISDLYISVKNNRFYLRSKTLNKEVIPRLTNVHSYFLTSLPLYIFLSDLTTQDSFYRMHYNFIDLLDLVSFLPRICYDNVILCPAIWRFSDNDAIINKIKNASTDEDLTKYVNEWQKNYKLPEKIILMEGEFELFIDLGSLTSIKLLRNEIKNKTFFMISEFLFSSKKSAVTSARGAFTNEILISYKINT